MLQINNLVLQKSNIYEVSDFIFQLKLLYAYTMKSYSYTGNIFVKPTVDHPAWGFLQFHQANTLFCAPETFYTFTYILLHFFISQNFNKNNIQKRVERRLNIKFLLHTLFDVNENTNTHISIMGVHSCTEGNPNLTQEYNVAKTRLSKVGSFMLYKRSSILKCSSFLREVFIFTDF